jgi:hypothetical protein
MTVQGAHNILAMSEYRSEHNRGYRLFIEAWQPYLLEHGYILEANDSNQGATTTMLSLNIRAMTRPLLMSK